MVFTVALIGHSQTPRINSYGDVRVSIFKPSPGLIDKVYNSEFSPRLFNTSWDVVIIFLGGNDLCRNTPDEVVAKLLRLVDRLTGRRLYVTLVEPRIYNAEREARHNITTEEYNIRARVTSTKLTRRAATLETFRTINICPSYHNNSYDGVHFDDFAKQSLIRRYIRAIALARSELN